KKSPALHNRLFRTYRFDGRLGAVQIEDGLPAALDQLAISRRRALRQDEMIGPVDCLVQILIDEPADVGDRLEEESAIAAVDLVDFDMRIEYPYRAALADQVFEQRDDRALAQIVGVLFESEPEDSEPLGREIEREAHRSAQ